MRKEDDHVAKKSLALKVDSKVRRSVLKKLIRTTKTEMMNDGPEWKKRIWCVDVTHCDGARTKTTVIT